MIYELALRNFDCSLEFVFSLLLLQPFNFSPVSFACNCQDWGCVILREIDFLLKICWSIPCLHPSWKVHTIWELLHLAICLSALYTRFKAQPDSPLRERGKVYKHFEGRRMIYSYFDFGLKNSSFRLPYQRPSSSADCARELFNGSNGSASLVDCTRKKILVASCGFFVTDVINEIVLGSFWFMLPGLRPKR